MSILGITIVGDGGSAEKALAAAAEGAKQYGATVEAVAAKTTAKLEAQRARLAELSAAYRDLAASAVEGSDAQVAAAKLATDAEAKLARQVQVASGEAEAQTAKLKEQALSMGAVTKEAKGLQGTVSKLSGSMAVWLGAPLLGAGLASAIKETQKFSASMEQLHTQAGTTQAEVVKMTAAVKGMASSVGTGPEELSTGLYHLESQGLRGAKALDALRISAQGARIGNANLEDVTNALGASIYAGIKGTENYTRTMGILNATVGAGDMRMQDLADAMGTGLPAAAALYGVSLKDVGAALAVFGDLNVRGAEAGTRLASALRLLAAPSKASAKELAGLGISATQLADDLRTRGLTYAIGDLSNHLTAMGLTASQQGVVVTRAFGGKQAAGIAQLVVAFDRLKQKEEDVGAGGNKFASDWQAYQKQSQFATQRFQAAIETLRIEVGQALLPEFTKATKGLADWLDRMNKSGAAARDTQKALHDLVAVVQSVERTVSAVDKVTGGFEHTMELLIGLKVGMMVGSWVAGFAQIGTAATATAGEVTALSTRLSALKFGAAGIIGVAAGMATNALAGHGGSTVTVASGKMAGTWVEQSDGTYKNAKTGLVSLGKPQGAVATGGGTGIFGAGLLTGNLAQGGYQQMAASAAAQYGLPTDLFLAQIKQESGFNPNAKSSAGALGIAQFMPGTAKGYGIDPMNPSQALPAAAKMMASLVAKYNGDYGLALAAYNAGSGTVDKFLAGRGTLPAETQAYVKSIMGASVSGYGTVHPTAGGASGTPTASDLAALGLGPSGGTTKKPKKPPIISGAAEIPKDLQDAIAKYTSLAKTSSGSAALLYVQDEKANLEAARYALEKILKGQTGKQAAATQREIDALTKKIDVPAIITGKDLLPQSLIDAIQKAKDAATSSTGATAEGYLVSERKLLEKAKADLQDELGSASGKQARAIRQEIDTINTQVAGVSKSIASNLKAQASAIKSNATSAISQGRSAITSAFSNLINDVKSTFEAETQNYIDTTLASKYFQNGGLTPLEQQLADMQAADTKQGLQDSIDQAAKQLALDQQTAGVTADQIAADQKALAQAHRAYDENELQIQATAERKQADLDYASAVRQYQQERSDAEHSMNVELTNLGKGIANGTATLDGPGGLNDILAKFGVTLTDVPADQFSSDMDTLSQATQDLALVFIAEAKALAKIGDSKDASAAAAAAAALNVGAVVTVPAAAQAALDAARQRSGKGAVPFATGGLVPGVFTGELDTVDARLTPGEFVLTRDQVAAGLGSGGSSIVVQMNPVFPNYVGDHRDLAAALKHPSVLEAVGTAVIKASRGGHIRQGDIRP